MASYNRKTALGARVTRRARAAASRAMAAAQRKRKWRQKRRKASRKRERNNKRKIVEAITIEGEMANGRRENDGVKIRRHEILALGDGKRAKIIRIRRASKWRKKKN